MQQKVAGRLAFQPCHADGKEDKPNSVIRDRTDYVRMSSSLSAAFAKGVAGYAEGKAAEKMPAIDRNQSISIIFGG